MFYTKEQVQLAADLHTLKATLHEPQSSYTRKTLGGRYDLQRIIIGEKHFTTQDFLDAEIVSISGTAEVPARWNEPARTVEILKYKELNHQHVLVVDDEALKKFNQAIEGYETLDEEILDIADVMGGAQSYYNRFCTRDANIQRLAEVPEKVYKALSFYALLSKAERPGGGCPSAFAEIVSRMFARGDINHLTSEQREELGKFVLEKSPQFYRDPTWKQIVGRTPGLREAHKIVGRESNEYQKIAGFLGRMAERKRFPKKEEAQKLFKNYLKRRHTQKFTGFVEAEWNSSTIAKFTEWFKDNAEPSENELKILRLLNLTRKRTARKPKAISPFRSPADAKRVRILPIGLEFVYEKLTGLNPDTNVKFGRLKQLTNFNCLAAPAKSWIVAQQQSLPMTAYKLVKKLQKDSTDVYLKKNSSGWRTYTLLNWPTTEACTISIGRKWYKKFGEKAPDQRRNLWTFLKENGHYRGTEGWFAHMRYAVIEAYIDNKWVRAFILEEIQADSFKRNSGLTNEGYEAFKETLADWEYYVLASALAKAREMRCAHILMSSEQVQQKRWGSGNRRFAPGIYETLPRRCGFEKKEIRVRLQTTSKNDSGYRSWPTKTSTITETTVPLWYRGAKDAPYNFITPYTKKPEAVIKNEKEMTQEKVNKNEKSEPSKESAFNDHQHADGAFQKVT